MVKKRKLKKKQKIIISLLSISILLSFAIMLKASITGMALFGHSWGEVTLPTIGDATTPSGTSSSIWPSLNTEFTLNTELLEGSSLADITGMAVSGSGIKCAWFFTTCPGGWLLFSSANYKCSSTTYNPPGATCDNTFHAANICCELT